MSERDEATHARLEVDRLRTVIRAFGWEIVATDTRSEQILVTVAKTKTPPPAQERPGR